MAKRKSASVDTDIIADNEAQMPQELKKLAEKGKEFAKANASMLLARWELGKLVGEATQNERKYGESAVRQLSIAWFGTPSEEALLQRCRVVATTYEKKDIQTLLKRQEQFGVQRLCWSHVDLLCQLQGAKAAKQRAKLENRVVDEGMSVSNLRKVIIDLQGGKRSNGGRQSMPRSPMAALQKLINEAQGLVNDEEVYDNYLFTPFSEMEDNDVGNADLLNQLNTAHETLEEALGVLTGQKEKLDQLIERSGALSGNAGEGDDEADDAAVADADDDDEDDAEPAAADDDDDEEAPPRKKTKKSKKGKKRRKAAVA